MVSVSDMTYTNIGIFNGEDNGVRFVFQARTFRLLMWRMRLTLLPLPGIAVALVHKNIMTALGMPVPVCVGGAASWVWRGEGKCGHRVIYAPTPLQFANRVAICKPRHAPQPCPK